MLALLLKVFTRVDRVYRPSPVKGRGIIVLLRSRIRDHVLSLLTARLESFFILIRQI